MPLIYETSADLQVQLLKALASLKDKYHLNETHTKFLAQNLSEVLFKQREASLSFENQIYEVKNRLEELIEKTGADANFLSENTVLPHR